MLRRLNLTFMLGLLGVVLMVYSCIAADEVDVRASIKFVPDNTLRDTTTTKFDVLGDLTTSAGRQIINTGAWEAVTISADISTNGWAFFQNIETASGSIIEIATAAATNVFMKLLPGEFALYPMNTNSLVARGTTTNAASCILNKIIINR